MRFQTCMNVILILVLLGMSTAEYFADMLPNALSAERSTKDSGETSDTSDASHVYDMPSSPAPKKLSDESIELLRQNLILKKLRQQLNTSSGYYHTLQDEIDDTKQRLQGVNDQIDTLEKQIAEMDRQIRISEQKIDTLRKKIAYAEARIAQLYDLIEIKEIELDENKKALENYLKLKYVNGITFNESYDDTLNMVKFLLSENSLGEILQKESYLQLFEDAEKDILWNLNLNKRELSVEKKLLDEERSEHSILKQDLLDTKTNLEAQKRGKEKLLEETQGKEEVYQQLLAETLQQQEEVLEEIQALRSNLSFFNNRLNLLKNAITPEEYEEILRIKEEAVGSSTQLQAGDILRFDIWPVRPNLGISAYFTDTNYKRVFGVDHGAVDIPVTQGSPVLAPANGLVVKVRNSDTGYNYVAIAHQKGVMTVYGHLTDALVDIGDFVHMGDIIGLSGGVPGTRGAGLRTTGAHMHFEVFQDGVRVDPLSGYLPLEALDKEYLPERYLKQLDASMEEYVDKVLR